MDRRYRFWLEMDSGERIEWGGLSARQAREMYTRTRVWHPRGVRIFGWGCRLSGAARRLESFIGHGPRPVRH